MAATSDSKKWDPLGLGSLVSIAIFSSFVSAIKSKVIELPFLLIFGSCSTLKFGSAFLMKAARAAFAEFRGVCDISSKFSM